VQRASTTTKALTLYAGVLSDITNQSDSHWVFTSSESLLDELDIWLDIAVEVLIKSARLEFGIEASSNFCSRHQYCDELEQIS
jgi:hypothetical protein